MFYVYESNSYTKLKDTLIDLLNKYQTKDIFTKQSIILGNNSISGWLELEIAKKLGIFANIEFFKPWLFLRKEIAFLYEKDFGKTPNQNKNRFNLINLVWEVYDILLSKEIILENFSNLYEYIDGDEYKAYSLAYLLASTFDEYSIYRPEYLKDWQDNLDSNLGLDYEKWQKQLWQEILKLINKKEISLDKILKSKSKIEIDSYFEKHSKKIIGNDIFIFGSSAISRSNLNYFYKYAETNNVHFLILNPSPTYWYEREFFDSEMHRLCSKYKKDSIFLLDSFLKNDIVRYEDFVEPKSNNLLNSLKSHIFYQRSFDILQEIPLKQDSSIEIHACYSPVREVEVLRDNILDWLDIDPNLKLSDIGVVVPNLKEYSNAFKVVFNQFSKNDTRSLMYRIFDMPYSDINQEILEKMFTLRESDLTKEVVFEFLNYNLIREAFDLTVDEILALQKIVDNLLIIKESANQELSYNSWEYAKKRILLGVALNFDYSIWNNIASFSVLSSSITEIYLKLMVFIDELSSWKSYLNKNHSFISWMEMITKLTNRCFFNDNLDRFLLKISNYISFLFESNHLVGASTIKDVLSTSLSKTSNKITPYLDMINVGINISLSARSYKYLAILGSNESNEPTEERRPYFNLIRQDPKPWDLSIANEAKAYFLESILNTENKLFLSYVSNSIETNEEMKYSSFIEDLINYISLYNEKDFQEVFDDFVVFHSIYSFSNENFQFANSYMKEWSSSTLDNKINYIGNLSGIENFNKNIPMTLNIDDLIFSLINPMKFFFSRQLGVYPKSYKKDLTEELFSLSGDLNLGLYNFAIKDSLFNSYKAISSSTIFNILKFQGKLPYFNFGKIAFNYIFDDMEKLREIDESFVKRDIVLDKMYLNIQNEDIILDLKFNLKNNTLIRYNFSTDISKSLVKLWFEYLLFIKNERNNSSKLSEDNLQEAVLLFLHKET
ncbi:MAG: exodeoxyribonuclease V subunit gamma, partial [Psittacicella sp.]